MHLDRRDFLKLSGLAMCSLVIPPDLLNLAPFGEVDPDKLAEQIASIFYIKNIFFDKKDPHAFIGFPTNDGMLSFSAEPVSDIPTKMQALLNLVNILRVYPPQLLQTWNHDINISILNNLTRTITQADGTKTTYNTPGLYSVRRGYEPPWITLSFTYMANTYPHHEIAHSLLVRYANEIDLSFRKINTIYKIPPYSDIRSKLCYEEPQLLLAKGGSASCYGMSQPWEDASEIAGGLFAGDMSIWRRSHEYGFSRYDQTRSEQRIDWAFKQKVAFIIEKLETISGITNLSRYFKAIAKKEPLPDFWGAQVN